MTLRSFGFAIPVVFAILRSVELKKFFCTSSNKKVMNKKNSTLRPRLTLNLRSAKKTLGIKVVDLIVRYNFYSPHFSVRGQIRGQKGSRKFRGALKYHNSGTTAPIACGPAPNDSAR